MIDNEMDDRSNSRPRARSEAVPPRRDANLSSATVESSHRDTLTDNPDGAQENGSRSPFGLPRRAATFADRGGRSPRRAVTTSLSPAEDRGASLRRRTTAISRTSANERPRSTTAQSQLNTMGVAGPEETPALRAAHENYVHPEYVEFNPAYEQPASAKPVWSLAKPLPRVIRPGMVPTKSEVDLALQNAQRPAEHTQKLGVDVDPTDLEEGRVQPTLNLSRLSAQLKDSRAQRETNFIRSVAQRRGTLTTQPSRLTTRPTRASSTASQVGRGRATSQANPGPMSPQEEVILEEGRQQHEQGIRLEPQRSPAGMPQAPGDALPPGRRSGEQQGPTEQLEPIPEYHEPPTRRSSIDSDLSQQTIRVDDEPEFYEDMNEHELKIEAENPPLYDEIHNNHTTWSIFRTEHREFFAELLGVFVQLTIGFCADMSATLNGNNANVNTTAWAWGFSVMVSIYVSGGISGAHLNPVITIMLWFYRGFPKRKMLPYFCAQFLGAILAGYTAYGLYYPSIHHYELTNSSQNILNGFVTGQRYDYITPACAFFNEFVGVMFLACTILALGDDTNAPPGAGMNSLVIGLLITLLNFSFAYQSGAAFNPARDFGPRLAMLSLGYGTKLFTNPFWFYGPWAGALCGAMVGAALYDVFIFTGGESPINYPWTRTKRSWKKGKAKWRRRVSVPINYVMRKGSMQKTGLDVEMGNARPAPFSGLEPRGVS